MKILPVTVKEVRILVAPEWKRSVFATIAGSSEKREVVKEIMKDPAMRKRGKEAADAVKQVTALVHKLPPDQVEGLLAHPLDELAVFEGARDFLEREFRAGITVLPAEGAAHPKAKQALPYKPAIVIE
jgi:leucyl-tRNA synthetase